MSITIEFQGVCTNFQPSELNGNVLPPGLDRVVLVNADREITIDGRLIPPHKAWLQLPTGPSIALAGCTLEIANPAQPGSLSYQPSYLSVIPNLTVLTAGANEILGPPSPAVVSGNDPAVASCYFDFVSGAFSGCVNVAAAVTRVLVETDGDPVLRLTPFPGSPMLPQTFQPPSGSTLRVIHAAENEDQPFDFLLHYLTAATMPPDPPIAPPISGPPCSTSTAASDVGIQKLVVISSCSNSTYP